MEFVRASGSQLDDGISGLWGCGVVALCSNRLRLIRFIPQCCGIPGRWIEDSRIAGFRDCGMVALSCNFAGFRDAGLSLDLTELQFRKTIIQAVEASSAS